MRNHADLITPTGRTVTTIVDVRADGLTPHYVYATSTVAARDLAKGSTTEVWEFVPTGEGHELQAVPADRYAGRAGTILIHPFMNATTTHERIIDSQHCLADGCNYTLTLSLSARREG